MKKPSVYIVHFEDGKSIVRGPYFTVYPDGCGLVIGQDWITYRVQDGNLQFSRITVPTRHYITTL